jgi:hypothetical protein
MKKFLTEMSFADLAELMKKGIDHAQIALAKFRNAGSSVGAQNYGGLFLVRYKSGDLSQRFDYKVAKDYAEIFNGQVIHARSGKVCWTCPGFQEKTDPAIGEAA